MIMSVRCTAHIVSANQARAFVLVNAMKSDIALSLNSSHLCGQTAKGRGSARAPTPFRKIGSRPLALPFWPTRLAVGLGLGSVLRASCTQRLHDAPRVSLRSSETFGSPAPHGFGLTNSRAASADRLSTTEC